MTSINDWEWPEDNGQDELEQFLKNNKNQELSVFWDPNIGTEATIKVGGASIDVVMDSDTLEETLKKNNWHKNGHIPSRGQETFRQDDNGDDGFPF